MSYTKLALRFKRAVLTPLVFVLAAATSAAQGPSVTYITYPGIPGFGFSGLTAGSDGALWFSGSGGVGKITTSGVITQYVSNAAGTIAAGPDGALWFTEPSARKIGRITTGGAITEYFIPSLAQPGSIAAGSDGALWFTENNAQRIGRITTAGMVTEFSVPSLNSTGALQITAGPDGNLWFTDFLDPCPGGPKIGRITTAGVVTEYPLPTCVGGGGSITAGPDGALWYTTFDPAIIGRITTSGVITEYPLGTIGAVPFDLVAGPDGALWFLLSDFEGDFLALERVTTAGVFTQYTLPLSLNAGNAALAAGPDNALWLADGGGPIPGNPFGQAPAVFLRIGLGSGLSITTTSLPVGTNGVAYAANLTAQGGTPPYTWTVIAGSLPAGLSLNPATGAISGTPSGSGSSFTVRVTDSSSSPQSATQALSIAISSPSSTFSIAASPSGLPISVDGVSYATPHTFPCNPGTQHTLVVSSPQPIVFVTGGRYSFTGWSDGVTSLTRQITCVSTATTYTANFSTQYLLTTTVSPAGAGSIIASPGSSDGFYNSGTAVQLTASGNFLSWSGDLSGSANPQSLVMSGPKSVTANFATSTGPSPITIFNTGVATGGNGLLPDGAVDPHYALIASADPGFPGPNAYVVNSVGFPMGPWVLNGPSSKWLAPQANQSSGNAQGTYTYRTTFDLTGLNQATAALSGQWAADNEAVMKLNGVVVASVAGFSTLTPFNITSGFVAGVNTLVFVVTNSPSTPNPTGLRVEISGTTH